MRIDRRWLRCPVPMEWERSRGEAQIPGWLVHQLHSSSNMRLCNFVWAASTILLTEKPRRLKVDLSAQSREPRMVIRTAQVLGGWLIVNASLRALQVSGSVEHHFI
jgi:hypothetical protein